MLRLHYCHTILKVEVDLPEGESISGAAEEGSETRHSVHDRPRTSG